MSMASEELSDRVRDLLGGLMAISEKKMFGGRCFMLHGNMLVCPLKSGSLMVRVGKDGMDDALAVPGVVPIQMRASVMTGFVEISGDMIEDDEALGEWIARAQAFVETLPAK